MKTFLILTYVFYNGMVIPHAPFPMDSYAACIEAKTSLESSDNAKSFKEQGGALRVECVTR